VANIEIFNIMKFDLVHQVKKIKS